MVTVMTVATDLAQFVLTDDDEVPVRLGDLWVDRPVVLAFVRHFGCMLCREQVNQLKKYVPAMRARGAELVIIGSGAEPYAKAFREDLALDVPILVDPSLASYRAAGLRRDLGATLSLEVAKNAWRAFKNGYRHRSFQGDPWQQGGVFVIAPGDRLCFAYVSKVGGDNPDPVDVLEAIPHRAEAAA